MTSINFDTHKAAQTLTNAGVKDEQADAHIEVLTKLTNELTTKKDLKLLEHNLTAAMWKMQFLTLVITLGGGFTLLQFLLPGMVTEAVMLAMGK